MAILNTFKSTVSTAAETMSNVAQRFVEKNRTNAKLNRLRLVMKNESELMNRAYIALGKQYYEAEKKGKPADVANKEKLFSVIDNSKAKIARARDCYRQIIENENEFLYNSSSQTEYNSEDVVDITVACSNESDYESSPFSDAAQSDAAEEAAEDNAETAEDEALEDNEAPEDELF